MISIMSDWPSLFDDAPLRRLFDEASLRSLEAGATVFRREEPVHSVFLVRSGTIALERPMADGSALTLHTAGKGTMLAEASLFADAYHCDAVVQGPARVASVPKRTVLAALQTSPGLALNLFARSAREVQAQRARVEILRLRRLADRLDAWLDIHGEPERGEWIKVAVAIGVTPPALYRELAKRR